MSDPGSVRRSRLSRWSDTRMLLCSDGSIVAESVDTVLRERMFESILRSVESVDSVWVPGDRASYAVAMEHGAFLWSGGLKRRYMRKMVFLVALLQLWNTEQRKKLPVPWKLAFAKESSFFPATTDPSSVETNADVDNIEAVLTHVSNTVNAQKIVLKCRSCGSDQIEDVAIQTRSADEGMTYFHRCCICSATFR